MRIALRATTKSRKSFCAMLAIACSAALPYAASATVTYSIESAASWPGNSGANAATAMAAICADYNAYGNFINFNFDVAYVSGVPTAQSTYLGQIQVGGSYNDSLLRRVLEHETNHVLGSGTTNAWYNEFNSSGVWLGTNMNTLAAEFDGDGTVIQQAGVHFYPYGLNYDTEVTDIDSAIGAETVYMRNAAIIYAEQQDDGLGNSANPWSATSCTLIASDAVGTSAFNNWGVWSDSHFTHAGAAYSTGNYILRTPLDTYNPTTASTSYTFAGSSLTVNNTNGAAGGLQYQGVGTSAVLTFSNLILNGGYVSQAGGAGNLFQIAGKVTLSQSPTIDASQGGINITAGIGGTGSLTKAGAYTLKLSAANTYTGSTVINAGTLQLGGGSPVASYSFDNVSGSTVINDGTGGSAMNGTLANGATIVANGRFGNAVSLANGASVNINSPITNLSNTGNWTVSAWVKTTTAGSSILSKGDGSTWTTGNTIFYLGNGSGTGGGGIPGGVRYAGGFLEGSTAASSVIDGSWHLVTYVNSGGSYAIYTDGAAQPLSTGNSGFGNADVGSVVRLGITTDNYAGDGTTNFNGLLDNVQVYSQALTTSQVASLYQGQSLPTLPATTNVSIAAGAVLDVNSFTQTIGSLTGPLGSAVKLGSGQLTVSSSASTTFAGNMSGINGSFIKAGSGTLILSGSNTFTGATTINGGILRLVTPTAVTISTPIASYSFAHISGNTVINDGSGGTSMNGTLDVNGGTGFISTTGGPAAGMGALVLNGNGTTVDINSGITDLSGTGTWTVSAWIKTTQAGATLFDKGNGSGWANGYSTFYLGTGNSTGSGGLPDAVRYAGGWVAGSTAVDDGGWHLVTYTDSAGTKTTYVDGVTDSISQNQFTTADTGSVVRIGFAPSSESDGEVATTGSLSGINFYNTALSAAQVASVYTKVVGGAPLPTTTPVTVAAASTLDLNGTTQTIANLTGPAGSSVTLGTGTLRMNTAGTSTFSGVISGGGSIAETGSGIQILGGDDTYTGTTTVTIGTLNLGANQQTSGILVRNLAGLTINSGKLIVGSAASHANRDVLVVGGTGLTIGGTPTAPSGLLDLGTNDLIVTGAGTTGLTAITSQLRAGFAGGAWTGMGVDSSAAAGDSTHLTAVGILLNNGIYGSAAGSLGTFDTINPGVNDVLLKYTYYGDANLDGAVDGSDYSDIDNGYLNQLTGWGNGDFNYDGVIDGSDYTLIDNAFNSQGANLTAEIAPGEVRISAQISESSPVPEPATFCSLLCLTTALLGRQRRVLALKYA